MILRILVGLVLLTPLPMAAVYPWTWSLMAAVIGALLIAWGVQLVLGREALLAPIVWIWWAALPFILVAAYAIMQASSLVPRELHHPLWRLAAEVLGTDYEGYISLNPSSTIDGLIRLLTYAGIFWLALQYGRQSKLAYRALYALTIATGLYAAYGLLIQFTGARMILWFDKTSYVSDLTSTFVNRNSFAAYAGLGFICATGLLVQGAYDAIDGLESIGERRRRLIEHLATRSWPLAGSWALLIVALLLTHSRAGFLSTVLGLVALFIAIGATRPSSRRVVFFLTGAATAIGILFFMLSGEITAKRFQHADLDAEGRLRVYERTLDAINDAPILGTGLGSFEEAFRFYRTEDIGAVFQMAHDTYLENALELGIPAAVALALSVAGLAALCVVGVRRRRRNAIYPCIGIAATTLVATHSLVDFSLQIPAITASYMLMLGIACAQSWSSRQRVKG